MTDTLRTRILTLAMAVVATFAVFGVVALAPGFAQQANAVGWVVVDSAVYEGEEEDVYDLYVNTGATFDFNEERLNQDERLMEFYLNGDMTFRWSYDPNGGDDFVPVPSSLYTGNGYCEIRVPSTYAGAKFRLEVFYGPGEEMHHEEYCIANLIGSVILKGDPCANVLVAGKYWNSDTIAAAQTMLTPYSSAYKVGNVELYKKSYKGSWLPVDKGTEISGGYYKFRVSVKPSNSNSRFVASSGVRIGDKAGSIDKSVFYENMWDNDPGVVKSLYVYSGEYYLGPEAVLSYSTTTWSGSVKSPSVYVRDNGTKLVKGKDYKVTTPSGRKSVGTYKYKVTFLGSYKDLGTWYLPLVINPKGTTQYTPSKTYTTVTAKWKKNSTKMSKYRISGYQVRYSKYKDFRTYETVTKKGYSTTSHKITKLYKGNRYHLQVRTYKVISGKYYYSSWSSTKSVTTLEHQD